MAEFKKSELELALLTISAYNPKTLELVSGLLKENITLGAKRRLQKTHKRINEVYKEFIEDVKTIKEECGDDKEKFKIEISELLNETVQIEIDPVDISLIENITTSDNYNFDIIEKITV